MLLFVVPAYNEEANIEALIRETHDFLATRGLPYHLIVVDDGSADRTADLVRTAAKKWPCEVVSYHPNKGVGEAFRRGLNRALDLAKEGDLIVTKEADRTSDMAILPDLLKKMESGCDAALASCYAKGGGIEGTTFSRMFLSRCANALIYAAFHIRGIHTYSSFYRVYRPESLRKVLTRYGDFYRETGFACVIELLVRLAKTGARIEEVPMVLVSGKRVGKSKMKVGRTILGYFRVIGRNFLR
jgi:dolichol-phosphate mannosyltransferase